MTTSTDDKSMRGTCPTCGTLCTMHPLTNGRSYTPLPPIAPQLPPSFPRLADTHRGWCNYCKGVVEVCRAAPEGGCSLRDVEREDLRAQIKQAQPNAELVKRIQQALAVQSNLPDVLLCRLLLTLAADALSLERSPLHKGKEHGS